MVLEWWFLVVLGGSGVVLDTHIPVVLDTHIPVVLDTHIPIGKVALDTHIPIASSGHPLIFTGTKLTT
jgi:hypothetical protein